MVPAGKQGSGEPTRFRIVVERFIGPSFAFTWDEGRLLLRESESGPSIRGKQSVYSPSPEQWVGFWDKADTLGVWRWRRSYENPDIDDGTQWELELSFNGRKVSCHGSNCYPPDNDSAPSEIFRQLITAVGELIDSREFMERWPDQL